MSIMPIERRLSITNESSSPVVVSSSTYEHEYYSSVLSIESIDLFRTTMSSPLISAAHTPNVPVGQSIDHERLQTCDTPNLTSIQNVLANNQSIRVHTSL
jgi:hypothetical protein